MFQIAVTVCAMGLGMPGGCAVLLSSGEPLTLSECQAAAPILESELKFQALDQGALAVASMSRCVPADGLDFPYNSTPLG